ncbi:hypothetical protein SLEP1_g47206 [Rubroshorea leprosula]|uniref:MPN domain-containing protein n=2 Tax=Rubroshorea leprosula TaxID=152421 RepID=A0AAV5LPS7_9ROSI|nr:hypothetical protein SLEP1_g47206 [Rubroshorea leprosula]
MGSFSRGINIATSAQRIDVDNRISLRYYFRIADNILKQADIFRGEKNIIDLYIMLLRFSSLVSETIPCHRDYGSSRQSKKVSLRKRLVNALNELEELKPAVQQKINELNRKHSYQNNSLEWPAVKNTTLTNHNVTKAIRPTSYAYGYYGSSNPHFLHPRTLNFPRAKEETLSKHSILGPDGLHGQWQPPRTDVKVQYPSNVDLTPVEIPSLQKYLENGLPVRNDHCKSEAEASIVESVINLNENSENGDNCNVKEPRPMISFEESEIPVQINITRQPSPPPVLAEMQDLVPAVSPQVSDAGCRIENSSVDNFVSSESHMELHISTTMMETFMKLAKSNTDRNLETCGVLAGLLKNRKFHVTALIIPKQESTSDSCQTTNEEEIFEVQDEKSLFPLGWIHTHPTQSCFMSSIDVHTHYSYQIMLPEAVAIVMAPRDTSRKHGIFRLTTPGGMSVIRNCQLRGFHPHDQPPDGGPIYKSCTDVYMNPNLKFDVIDLR